jgi:putative ubiquitin-RnfH superfamily antitoxin RatB of RatAB toxin-antitoxin module
MPDQDVIEIEVAYARPQRQRIVTLQVRAGSSVRDALRQSRLGDEFAEIDMQHCPVGVFGREITDDYVIKAGDRIEIYRPLERDPRDARRELAARGLTM